MAIFNQLLSSIFLAVVCASVADAAPWPHHATHSSHRTRHYGRNAQVVTFHPTNSFQTFSAGLDQATSSLTRRENGTIADSAISFVTGYMGVTADQVAYKSGYTRDAEKFAYVKQAHDGIPFANAVANIAWKDGKVTTFGNSFVKPSSYPSSTPTLSLDSVIPQTENTLQSEFYNGSAPTIEWLARPDGSVALAHVFQLRAPTGSWMEAFVDGHSGDLLSVTDFAADATYTVVPVDRLSVLDGLVTLQDPENLQSSPLGWHDDGVTKFTNTSGNNVIAAKGNVFGAAQESSDDLNFNFVFDTTNDPTEKGNLDAATTNAFYVANVVHDFSYLYGFTEEAFNFQQNNFGKGGQDEDRVLLSVQDADGLNNANFMSPPDGQNGLCRMFIFNETNPRRDGSMENDVVSHEMTHGITNRMTGGGTGRCLQTLESGGLGEGWSDAVAGWIQQSDDQIRDFTMGQYVTGDEGGIRSHPYSTSSKVNPLRYHDLQHLDEVHDIGEVWANMLHNVYAALVNETGFSPHYLSDPTGPEGNVVFMHLLIDALVLQPCNPTFANARDSWIQADQNRYNGTHVCTFMGAFASRGLGINAGSDFEDDDTLPDGC